MSLAMCPRCGKNTTEIHSCSPNSVITALRDEVAALREISERKQMCYTELYGQQEELLRKVAVLTEKIVTLQSDNELLTKERDIGSAAG